MTSKVTRKKIFPTYKAHLHWKHNTTTTNLKNPQTPNPFKYSMRFTTIYTPGTIKNISILEAPLKTFEKSRPQSAHKILVKQSYMMLTWMTYVHNNSFDLRKISSCPSLFVQPIKRRRFTITKAPMAHKTFSQEQYLFQSYRLTVAFTSAQKLNDIIPPTINQSIALMLLSRRIAQGAHETNLLTLSRIRVTSSAGDPAYMQLM